MVLDDLIQKLSKEGTITTDSPSRWSTYKAPNPIAVVNVNSEQDVAETVRFCNDHNLPFLAQNGGSGWAAFPETKNLVIINLARLNGITIAPDKQSAIIGGGARISETITQADAAGVLIQTGNCNGAGTLGVLLGGGYGNLMGQTGFGVDNILELRFVTATGTLLTASPTQQPDLFWAMCGAGPNFGIVTSAVVKTYPTSAEERSAWCGALIFSSDKLERVVQAIQDLHLSSDMVLFMYFASGGAPSHSPIIFVTPWLFQGTPASGKRAFKQLYDVGPVAENTAVLPYTQWNSAADLFSAHGQQKPSFAAGLERLETGAWREVWEMYVAFQRRPTAHASAVLLEVYPMNAVRLAGQEDTAFPHRGVRFNAAVLTWYTDDGLDGEALRCGKEIREVWRESSGRGVDATYINFAHGDEPLEEIYGESLPRLRKLKGEWDPENRFGQWFGIR